MGHPHPTVDVPGRWPVVAAEVRSLADQQPLAAELLAGLDGGHVVAGHVCATAWIVSPGRRRMLLVRHPRLGWSNPGGHLEQHETTAQAVVREVHEETGLTLSTDGRAPVAVHVTDVDGDAPHRHWNVAWVFEVDPTVPVRAEGDTPVAWFDVDDLPSPRADDLDATWLIVAAALAAAEAGQ